MTPPIRKHLKFLTPYTPLVPPDLMGVTSGRADKRVVKLDGNENPYGCSPRVRDALAKLETAHLYPDPESRRLRLALARYVGVDASYIIAGAGSDEIIDLLLRLFVEPGDRVITCVPTFGMYAFDTQVCGGKVVEVRRRPDFSIDVGRVRSAATSRAKMLFLASPNNPSGNVTPRADVETLLSLGLVVVVDEAYYEFCGESVVSLVPRHPNLVVLRTFSKWAGLAGLRVGYGVMSPDLVGRLMQIKQPYNVSVAAQVAAEESLRDLPALQRTVKAIVRERERLHKRLKGLVFLEPYPSRANFVLCRVLRGDAKGLRDWLQEQGILVRYFDTALLKNMVRMSVGKPEHTDALIAALARWRGQLSVP
ncbi:MAG: histidinol-phosphate transaminase [Chloroflexi bacterium]|nr:histidinol-phosphate transaminase [Chloroflexota bacterium]